MIRALIVDDEALARANLIAMLDGMVEIVGEAAHGVAALESVLELEPDAVFLDIEMPGMTGFEVLAELAEPPMIVFVTAHGDRAIEAFDAHAVDYILKPLRRERVRAAVARLESGGAHPQALRELKRRFPGVAKIAGRRGRNVVLLAPSEILWVGADEGLVFLYTAAERFLATRTLAELDGVLSSRGFMRISRSVLVNLEHARELKPVSSGTWELVLRNGRELDVSRERARELRAAMGF